MSQEVEKVAERLDTLLSKVYVPVFMEKLAQAGIVAQSPEEAEELLKIAAFTRLHAAEAEAEPSVIKEAAASLEKLAEGQTDLVDVFLADEDVAEALQ